MKNLLFLLFAAMGMFAHSQVAVNADGSQPDNSAMMDVKSTDKGFLIPRMTTAEMLLIPSPAAGLLVYNTTSQAFYCYTSTTWTMLKAGSANILKDADGDTKVEVEKNSDEDIIRFSLAGTEKMILRNSRLDFPDPTGNIFIGSYAGASNTTGSANTALGFFSLANNVSGQNNIGLGYYTLLANIAGSDNIAIGRYALQSTTSSSNVAVGSSALYSNTIGYENTANGYYALSSNTAGNSNIAVGNDALYSNTMASRNTAIGVKALYTQSYNTGTAWNSDNVAIGYEALYSNQPTWVFEGLNNTAIGNFTLRSNTTGYCNTANGWGALYNNSTAGYNTGIGAYALHDNTSGHDNVAVGGNALYANITGHYNTAIGDGALNGNTTGHFNTAIGSSACNAANSDDNTCVGYHAGYNLTSFAQGTFLGSNAFPSANGYTNCMALGYNARVNASTKVVIGNTAVTSIGGYADWTNFSDQRYKTAVQENVKGLEFILKLRPVTYQLDINKLAAVLKEDQRIDDDGKIIMDSTSSMDLVSREEKSGVVYTGFLAQEVEAAAKSIGFDFSGVDAPKNENDMYGLRYAEFVVPLVKAVQEQQQQIEELKAENDELKEQMMAIENKLAGK